MLRDFLSNLYPYFLYTIQVWEEVYSLDISDLSLKKASQHLKLLQELLCIPSLKEHSERI